MRQIIQCRICKSDKLIKFLDLGEQPLANAFLSEEDLNKPENKYSLQVFFCKNCNLCQLGMVVDPEVLFRNYIYFSSGMPVLPEHFKNYAEEVVHNFIGFPEQLVVEIGSNDGLLLGAIKNLGARVLGVDPALNIAKIANERKIETIADFFSERLAEQILEKYGPAKVIIGNNVVAHIDDHHDLVKGIYKLLSDDGIFIFEAPYLVDMFENLTFDTIYHEHLSYLALRPLIKLFNQFGMEIFDAKIFPVQGNSLRVYACKKGKQEIKPSVNELIRKEKDMAMDKFETYVALAHRIEELKIKIINLLKDLKGQRKRIAGYGAPAKGNTFLNYFGTGPEVLDYLTEGLPSKIGLFSPGMHIPVVDIKWAKQNPPDYYLMLAWNYASDILKKEQDFIQRGGKFIIPVGEGRNI